MDQAELLFEIMIQLGQLVTATTKLTGAVLVGTALIAITIFTKSKTLTLIRTFTHKTLKPERE